VLRCLPLTPLAAAIRQLKPQNRIHARHTRPKLCACEKCGLDANANAVAIEHIKLENEGWERDTSVVPSPQP
jgi:hypothetical protein